MAEPPLIDIGANLVHPSFDADREAVIERATAAGVAAMVVTGTSVADSQAAADLARAWPGRLYATAGVHPHDAKRCDTETIPALRALAERPEVRAIGECGLDFNRDFSPRAEQVACFQNQVALAVELGMPLFLHERDAHSVFLAVLDAHGDRLPAAVVHCFTGSSAELEAYLERDLYIGITGWICDERRGLHLRELVGRIPSDRLLVETDAPFLLPRDLRPRPRQHRNEPAFLPHIVQAIAQCAGRPNEQVAAETYTNAWRFFRLDARGGSQPDVGGRPGDGAQAQQAPGPGDGAAGLARAVPSAP